MFHYRLTATDASGLSTIGITNFTVFEEKDYPPIANAGSAILLHLPNNEVMLSGEASRDDKSIVKYEWSELEGKPVDTEVSVICTGVGVVIWVWFGTVVGVTWPVCGVLSDLYYID